MNSADMNTNLVDNYFSLLKNLDTDNKLELIARLSESMKTNKQAKDDSWKALFGALVLDQPVDDFVENLKKDRTFSHKSIEL